MKTLNILSPGPSLERMTEADLLDGPVVAVNTAMCVWPSSDVWLVHGPVKALHKKLDEFGKTWAMVRPGEVWAASCFDWDEEQRQMIAGADYRGWPIGQDVFGRDLLGWDTKVTWSYVPALCGAGLAIKHGYKHVRLFGLDMDGTGFAGIDGGPLKWVPTVDDNKRKQWRKERAIVDQAVRECSEHGVTLEVWEPVEAPRVA